MALDLATKSKIRRHLGVPASGAATANTTLGLRTISQAGTLEFYMNGNALTIEDECVLLGRPYGAFLLNGPYATGTTFSVMINNVMSAYTVQASDNLAVDPVLTIANNFLLTIQTANPTLIGTCAVLKSNPFVTQPPYQTLVAQLSLQSIAGAFSLTSGTLPVISDGSAFPSPSLQIDDGNGIPANAQYAYGLLPVCDALEGQLLATSQNLSFSNVGAAATGQAVFRPDELGVRWSLLARYRFEMGRMLGFYAANPASGIRGGGITV